MHLAMQHNFVHIKNIIFIINYSQIKTPKSASKRKSKIDRDRAESEEIIKSMGGPLEDGARRTRSTRSSARGTAAAPVTPTSAKKAKISTPSTRGRGKKEVVENHDEEKVNF